MSDQNSKKAFVFDEGEFTHVSVSALRTTYSPLRAGSLPLSLSEALNPLPIRVVPTDDGHFEIIDGFKRFAAWQSDGREKIPVIIESPGSSAEQKRLLLSANSPARTLTPLDEGLVICSLFEDDQMKPSAVAKLLARKKEWVIQRAAMAKKLSPVAQQKLGSGEIGPTIGKLLTSLNAKEQDELLNCFSGHKLRVCDQQIVIQAYRISDSAERKGLLASPTGTIAPNSNPIFSPLTNTLDNRLKRGLDAINDLQSFHIPAELSSSETRRLEALVKQFLNRARDALTILSESFAIPINEEKKHVKNHETHSHSRIESSHSEHNSGDAGREQCSQNHGIPEQNNAMPEYFAASGEKGSRPIIHGSLAGPITKKAGVEACCDDCVVTGNINKEKMNVKNQEKNTHRTSVKGSSGGDSGNDDSREQHSQDLRLSEPFPRSCSKGSGEVWGCFENACAGTVEADELSGRDRSTCDGWSDDDQNPERDQETWLQGGENNSGQNGEQPSIPGSIAKTQTGQTEV